MRKLVITEKFHSAARIATILSDGKARRGRVAGVPVFEFSRPDGEYVLIGLRGHIIVLDYPDRYSDWESVPIQELIRVEPVKSVDSFAKRLFSALGRIASDVDEIVIATDYDREGELIGVETLRQLRWDRPVSRAKFSALTRDEILSAFDDLTSVDFKLADAAETRQFIDLMWGASLTRFLSLAAERRWRNFISAGRVQSPTLALLVDRDKSISEFRPQTYWELFAKLSKERAQEVFTARSARGRIESKEEAEELFSRLKGADTATVESYADEKQRERPPTPFNTTQFLAEASKLRITAPQAMKIAEDLYNDGYISYPRTDNTVYPPSLNLRRILDKLEETEFAEYASKLKSMGRIRATAGRRTATDHPPIHPTGSATRQRLRGNHWRIYELVCRRFLATVSPYAEVRVQEAGLTINEEAFQASGRMLTEPGWREIYVYWRFDGTPIPDLVVGEKVDVKKVEMKEEKTKPPPRYTQGTLIQEMERLGLGTKSTRHEIIQKLYERKFVQGSQMTPTLVGVALIDALEKHAKELTDNKMTARLEEHMDEIAQGEMTKDEIIEESQAILETIVDILNTNRLKIADDIKHALDRQRNLGRCPGCGKGDMQIITTRDGKRFIGCNRYPDCRTTFPVPAMGHIVPTEEACETCGAPLVRVPENGRNANSVCINPDCPNRKRDNDLGDCPKCDGGRLRLKYSSRGRRFIACDRYPECENSYPLPQRGGVVATTSRCDRCGAPIVRIVTRGRRPWDLCPDPNCGSKDRTGSDKKETKRG